MAAEELTAGAGRELEMGAVDFATSCALCHPGGGPLEYSRHDSASTSLAGWLYPDTGTLMSDGGALGAGDKNWFLTKGMPYWYFTQYGMTPSVTQGGINTNWNWFSGENHVRQEVDCLMCHLSSQYNNQSRGAALRKLRGAWGPSAGIGASLPTDNSKQPRPITGISGLRTQITAADISRVKTENCAICHAGNGADTTLLGPAGQQVERGRLVFQSQQQPASLYDADDNPFAWGPTNQPSCNSALAANIGAAAYTATGDCANNELWVINAGRASFGKRGFTVNNDMGWLLGFGEKDVHMDSSLGGMNCASCHYAYEGPAANTTIAGGIYADFPAVTKMDHQFTKGHSFPDGKNMDNLDNTVSCESCHIDQNHPKLVLVGDKHFIGTKEVKRPAHTGFPALHFAKIDCRTCHIPYVKPERFAARDFTTGPWRLHGNREQKEVGTIRPSRIWAETSHGGPVKIMPATLGISFIWANYTDAANDKINPIYTRMGFNAAEGRNKASAMGWLFNKAGENRFLMVNTSAEIDLMAQSLSALTPPVPQPVMNLYANIFSVSHNVKLKGEALGSAAMGGCVGCHSSGDNPVSRGFFDRTIDLYKPVTDHADTTNSICSGDAAHPADGTSKLCGTENSEGLQQAVTTVNGTAASRVRAKIGPLRNSAGAGFAVDLAAGKLHGEKIRQSVNQAELLGYTPAQISYLTSPEVAGVESPVAYFTFTTDPAVSKKVLFDASASKCNPAGAICAYTWDFGGAGTPDMSDTVKPSYTYQAAGTYRVTLKVHNGQAQGVRSQDVTAVEINSKPVASYVMDAASTGKRVVLNDTSTDADGDALTVRIAWGDGRESTGAGGAAFENTYRLNGTYKVFYRVTDSKGASSILSFTVKVPLP